MQIQYEITPSDHLEMMKAKFGISAMLAQILLSIAGTCLGILAYYFFGGEWDMVIIVFAVLTIFQFFMPYIAHWRVYNRNPSLF